MTLPLELHLGLVRLSTELGHMQRVVQDLLVRDELLRGDTGSQDAVANAQYLALEAAIRCQESGGADVGADESERIEWQSHESDPGSGATLVSIGRRTRGVPKPDELARLLRIGRVPGQRIGRDDRERVFAASRSSEDPAPAVERRTAARR